ncbi:response regulator transcription factor [candidate division KSB1 bacterium]
MTLEIMSHLLIILYIACLIVGMWSIFYIRQLYISYDYSFLKSLSYYSAFFNLSVVVYIVILYLNANVDEIVVSISNHQFVFIISPIEFLTMVGVFFSFIVFLINLQGLPFSTTKKKLWFIGIAFSTLCYLTGIYLYLENSSVRWILLTTRYIYIVGSIFIALSLLYLLARRKFSEFPGKELAGNIIGIFYLFIFISLFSLEYSQHTYNPIFLLILSVLFNIFPIILFKYNVVKSWQKTKQDKVETITLNEIIKKYKISKREHEIILLLLEGKNNSEIEEKLFISYSTVKNHIYNIYQKMGVTSRGQLVYFFNNVED